jgi:PAS domain S-box-containing protein
VGDDPEGARILESFFAKSLDLFVIADHDHRWQRLNPAWERLLGYPLDELVGKRYTDFVHSDDVERTSVVASALREGESWVDGFENRYICRNGEVRWLRWSSVFGREEGLVYAVATDVTELKRAEEGRRRSEQMLECGEELAALGSWHLHLETGRWEWSQGLHRLTGVSPEEFDDSFEFTLGLVHPEDRAHVNDALRRVRAGERVVTRYRFLRRPDGEVRIADTVAERDESGAEIASGVLIDVTERVQAEEEARRLESRLQQSQRLETVGRLAGGVAHDFNNLLSVILNNATLAAEGLAADAAGRTELEEVVRAAGQAAELTHQLLLFSRQESVEPEVLDPNGVVRRAEWLLHRTLGEDAELSLDLAEDMPTVEVDSGQLERVIVNLAVNARDAMPSGGKLLVATEAPELSGERHARIRVVDNGHGMTEDVAARAFEPFFTTKPTGEGSGLGLATAYGIVTQAGGEISLSSAPERGTEATITLPAAEEPPTARPRRGESPAGSGRRATVLVVEDEPSVRRLVARLLRAEGHSVLEAAGPREALAACEDSTAKIDLMLTDVVMPVMSGRELADRLRGARPDTAILYMSGYTDEVIVRHGVTTATSIVSKPFDRETLVSAVNAALAARAEA